MAMGIRNTTKCLIKNDPRVPAFIEGMLTDGQPYGIVLVNIHPDYSGYTACLMVSSSEPFQVSEEDGKTKIKGTALGYTTYVYSPFLGATVWTNFGTSTDSAYGNTLDGSSVLVWANHDVVNVTTESVVLEEMPVGEYEFVGGKVFPDIPEEYSSTYLYACIVSISSAMYGLICSDEPLYYFNDPETAYLDFLDAKGNGVLLTLNEAEGTPIWELTGDSSTIVDDSTMLPMGIVDNYEYSVVWTNYNIYEADTSGDTPTSTEEKYFIKNNIEADSLVVDGVLLPKLPEGAFKYSVITKMVYTMSSGTEVFYLLSTSDSKGVYVSSELSGQAEGVGTVFPLDGTASSAVYMCFGGDDEWTLDSEDDYMAMVGSVDYGSTMSITCTIEWSNFDIKCVESLPEDETGEVVVGEEVFHYDDTIFIVDGVVLPAFPADVATYYPYSIVRSMRNVSVETGEESTVYTLSATTSPIECANFSDLGAEESAIMSELLLSRTPSAVGYTYDPINNTWKLNTVEDLPFFIMFFGLVADNGISLGVHGEASTGSTDIFYTMLWSSHDITVALMDVEALEADIPVWESTSEVYFPASVSPDGSRPDTPDDPEEPPVVEPEPEPEPEPEVPEYGRIKRQTLQRIIDQIRRLSGVNEKMTPERASEVWFSIEALEDISEVMF